MGHFKIVAHCYNKALIKPSLKRNSLKKTKAYTGQFLVTEQLFCVRGPLFPGTK